jgi:hypothetical protein
VVQFSPGADNWVNPFSREIPMHRITSVLLMCAVVGTAAGCGSADVGGDKPSKAANAKPDARTLAYNKAVLQSAAMYFPSQNISSASCRKTGFVSVGDIVTCTLGGRDGFVTDPSEWWALPQKNDGLGRNEGHAGEIYYQAGPCNGGSVC